jgi:C-terminal processing protease CtpA/Prc
MDLVGRFSSDRSLVLDYKYTVQSVDPTGPAAKAGIKRGDRVVCESEGAPTNRSAGIEFAHHIEIGVPMSLKVYAFRSNESRTVTITPVERPENSPFLKGIERNRENLFKELLRDIPHTRDSITGIRVKGDARIGYIRMISHDPIPADFKPVKVSFYSTDSYRSASGTLNKSTALRGFKLDLPDIPIPPEFWE